MNRRDFLMVRVAARRRVAELSCERLYMNYVDSRQGAESPQAIDVNASPEEPPAVFERRTTEQLFDDAARRLSDSDVVRVVDAGWLACDDFRVRVEALLAAVRDRGGRVEYGATTGTTAAAGVGDR